MKHISPFLALFFLSACDEPTQMVLTIPSGRDTSSKTEFAPGDSGSKEKDAVYHGYNEMADPATRSTFTVSDYNTDNPAIKNIDRPKVSVIETGLDTSLLFGVWGHGPDAPHADFVWSRENIYYVDYDGDGRMPYELKGNKIKIWYNDFIWEGEIVSVAKDTLKIRNSEFDEPSIQIRWK